MRLRAVVLLLWMIEDQINFEAGVRSWVFHCFLVLSHATRFRVVEW